jgi:hypothetical protein
LTIDSLKDLQKLLKLCRQQGVTSIKIDGIELNISTQTNLASVNVKSQIDLNAFPEADWNIPPYNPVNVQDTATEVIEPKIDMPDELTDEQLMFYSAKPEVQ